MSGAATITHSVPARASGDVAADLNGLAARDPARERTRPPALPELAPIPASHGVADWGVEQAPGTAG